jgi:hypothetical protein
MIFYLLRIPDPSKYSVNNDLFLKLLTEVAEWQHMRAGGEHGPESYRNPATGAKISELRPINKKCQHCERILPHGTHLRINVNARNQWQKKCIPCGSLIDAAGTVIKNFMFKKQVRDSAGLLEHQDCTQECQSTTTEIVPNDECVRDFVDPAVVPHYRESQIVDFVPQPIESPPAPSAGQELDNAVHKG